MSFQRCSSPSTYSFIKRFFLLPFFHHFSSSLSNNRRMGFSSFTFLCFSLLPSFLLLLLPFSSSSPSNLPVLSFHEAYNHLFGDANLLLLNHGKSVHLYLDERTGPLFLPFFLSLQIYFNPFVFLFFLFFFLFRFLFSGAGFLSQDLYLHGFFSASIKLPADYTAGVVVAFYVSWIVVFVGFLGNAFNCVSLISD